MPDIYIYNIHSLDNYLNFNKVLSDIFLSFKTYNVKHCIVGGDMNCDVMSLLSIHLFMLSHYVIVSIVEYQI